MKLSSMSPPVAAAAAAAPSSSSMAPLPLRSLLLPRRSPPSLFAREGRSSWSFGSSQLMRGGYVHSLSSRDDGEKRAEPKIASKAKAAAMATATTMAPGVAHRGGADNGGRRRGTRNLHLHARAFSARLPGESPARDAAVAAAAAAAGAVGPLGYRRDEEEGGAGAPPPPPPPPPPPLAAAKPPWASNPFPDASSSSSAHPHASPHHSRADSAALARELHTVSVAIAANAAIFAAKACAYAATGSSAMLAECVHSVVDTANQALLRLGVTRSRRPPTALHPYGFMKDKFVWSLVSAVSPFLSSFFFFFFTFKKRKERTNS